MTDEGLIHGIQRDIAVTIDTDQFSGMDRKIKGDERVDGKIAHGKQRRCGDQRRLICLDVERIIDVDVEAQDVLLCKAVCFGKAADDGSEL